MRPVQTPGLHWNPGSPFWHTLPPPPRARWLPLHLRLDPVMSDLYQKVQAFCRMIRARRGHACDAWIAAVEQTGVNEGAASLREGLAQGCSSRARRPITGVESRPDGGLYPAGKAPETASLWAGRRRLLAPPHPWAVRRGSGLALDAERMRADKGVVTSACGRIMHEKGRG